MKDETIFDRPETLTKPFDAAARPSLTIDLETYQEFLDSSGMSDAQKEGFLSAMWAIIVNFVDLGFEVHPLQEAMGKNNCGQNDEIHDYSTQDNADRVGSKQEQTQPSGP